MEQSTWIGRSLNGRYKIDALLGQGGMSAVYKATDPNLKRVVAIKLIHPHLSTDSDFVYRFKKEAAAVAALRHPNIIQVFDFNTDNDVYYMVLEFVPGETLQDRLKHLKQSNARMPVDQAVRILLNICDALSYAHKQGIIHRDIKPANIMLDVHGQAILMDFGIVKILDDTSHTATGAVVGTARYMSPEVIRSEVPDERSDLYSLGVTFYEMLSGDPPFDAPSAMSLLMRHLNDPVPDLKTKRPDLPSELIRIVNKTLEKERENRYRSAAELAGDLRRLLSALETAPLPTATPAPKPVPPADDPTQPWEVQSQGDSLVSQPTAVEQTPQPAQATLREAVEGPRRESLKMETKREVRPAAPMSPVAKFGGLGGLALLLLVGGFFVMRGMLSSSSEPTSNPTAAFTQPASVATFTASPETDTPEPTPTLEPTATLALTPTPSTPYVVITGILLENNRYVVNYEVHNFPESPSLHVHMFFNTVPPEQAGMPGSGPWKLTWGAYGDPPFTGYGPADRPAAATQMCALVANPNHSVQAGSGNCFDLP
ncbi:MAG: protein kinase [Chloroflexi bacterium]|nr:protein kinase [Chloroflexota bacterium]